MKPIFIVPICIAFTFLCIGSVHGKPLAPASLLPGSTGWRDSGFEPIRGLTFGVIESARHPGKGYGSHAFERAVYEAHQMGTNWVSLTVYGRVLDIHPSGIDLSFEAPFEQNRRDVQRAIEIAHALNMKVLLVPHIWVEAGDAHCDIDPGDDAAWARYADSYARFILIWARVAEEAGAEMFSLGVEQKSWVSTPRAPLFYPLIRNVRDVYHGLLTYSGNWWDAAYFPFWGSLDIIGINAFYPLSDREGARYQDLLKGGLGVAQTAHNLTKQWQRSVVFTEFGYSARENCAVENASIHPNVWPENMSGVQANEPAQAQAYAAVIGPMLMEPSFMGLFVWRVYADPDDVSQEPEWAFSPRGKLAELVLRDAFYARWASDPAVTPGDLIPRFAAETPGVYEGPTRPPWW